MLQRFVGEGRGRVHVRAPLKRARGAAGRYYSYSIVRLYGVLCPAPLGGGTRGGCCARAAARQDAMQRRSHR